jgi:hypothetical protein
MGVDVPYEAAELAHEVAAGRPGREADLRDSGGKVHPNPEAVGVPPGEGHDVSKVHLPA